MKKIFGIGLARTGTTTLAKALELLGYKSVHVECNVMEVTNSFAINNDVTEKNDAIIGTPLSPCYAKLAHKYPDALFILTIRDSTSWLNSCALGFITEKYMDDNHRALHRWLYDSILYDRDKFLKGYTDFVTKVLSFFNNNFRHRLFAYNICSGVGWQPLCRFLNVPIPKCPLPHESKRRQQIIKKSIEYNQTLECPYCSKTKLIYLKSTESPTGKLYRCDNCNKKVFKEGTFERNCSFV